MVPLTQPDTLSAGPSPLGSGERRWEDIKQQLRLIVRAEPAGPLINAPESSATRAPSNTDHSPPETRAAARLLGVERLQNGEALEDVLLDAVEAVAKDTAWPSRAVLSENMLLPPAGTAKRYPIVDEASVQAYMIALLRGTVCELAAVISGEESTVLSDTTHRRINGRVDQIITEMNADLSLRDLFSCMLEFKVGKHIRGRKGMDEVSVLAAQGTRFTMPGVLKARSAPLSLRDVDKRTPAVPPNSSATTSTSPAPRSTSRSIPPRTIVTRSSTAAATFSSPLSSTGASADASQSSPSEKVSPASLSLEESSLPPGPSPRSHLARPSPRSSDSGPTPAVSSDPQNSPRTRTTSAFSSLNRRGRSAPYPQTNSAGTSTSRRTASGTRQAEPRAPWGWPTDVADQPSPGSALRLLAAKLVAQLFTQFASRSADFRDRPSPKPDSLDGQPSFLASDEFIQLYLFHAKDLQREVQDEGEDVEMRRTDPSPPDESDGPAEPGGAGEGGAGSGTGQGGGGRTEEAEDIPPSRVASGAADDSLEGEVAGELPVAEGETGGPSSFTNETNLSLLPPSPSSSSDTQPSPTFPSRPSPVTSPDTSPMKHLVLSSFTSANNALSALAPSDDPSSTTSPLLDPLGPAQPPSDAISGTSSVGPVIPAASAFLTPTTPEDAVLLPATLESVVLKAPNGATTIIQRHPLSRPSAPPPSLPTTTVEGSAIPALYLTKELGSGGSGTVWEEASGRLVAKVLVVEEEDDWSRHEEIAQEGAMNEVLDSLGVVSNRPKYYGRFISDEASLAVLLFDKVAGTALKSWVEVARHKSQALAILEELHAAGITHGDFWPQNLFLTPKGELLLVDFGRSRRVERDGPEVREELEEVRRRLEASERADREDELGMEGMEEVVTFW
ncbi:hypothetical protein JCM8547_001604 [Rhodosporidiobolus lusitaniae]